MTARPPGRHAAGAPGAGPPRPPHTPRRSARARPDALDPLRPPHPVPDARGRDRPGRGGRSSTTSTSSTGGVLKEAVYLLVEGELQNDEEHGLAVVAHRVMDLAQGARPRRGAAGGRAARRRSRRRTRLPPPRRLGAAGGRATDATRPHRLRPGHTWLRTASTPRAAATVRIVVHSTAPAVSQTTSRRRGAPSPTPRAAESGTPSTSGPIRPKPTTP